MNNFPVLLYEDLASAMYMGEMFLCGMEDSSRNSTCIYKYNGLSDSWSTEGLMPYHVVDMIMCGNRDGFYVIGDVDTLADEYLMKSILFFNINTKQTTMIKNSFADNREFTFARGLLYDDQFYVIARNGLIVGLVSSYSISQQSWKEYGNVPLSNGQPQLDGGCYAMLVVPYNWQRG